MNISLYERHAQHADDITTGGMPLLQKRPLLIEGTQTRQDFISQGDTGVLEVFLVKGSLLVCLTCSMD